MSFGQVCVVKYSERWIVQPSQFECRPFFFFVGDHHKLDRKLAQFEWRTFFLEITTNWTEKPAQFEWRTFFLDVTSIKTEETIDLSGNFQVIFRAKLWCPPITFWAPTPMLTLVKNSSLKLSPVSRCWPSVPNLNYLKISINYFRIFGIWRRSCAPQIMSFFSNKIYSQQHLFKAF